MAFIIAARRTRQKAALLSRFKAEPFRAAVWLPSPHGQTLGGRLLRRPRLPELTRIRLDTPDGDFLDIDVPQAPAPNSPLVVLFHGLEGSARRGYAINTYRELYARGVGAIGVNFRSCSGENNRTARFYHSGETEDIAFVLDHVAREYAGRRIGAIGFSLGGNALLKYLGENGNAAKLHCAVAISVPYDLGAGARLLESTRMGRFYSRVFIKSLILKAEAKAALLTDRCDLERVRRATTFYEFDDAATAPLHGFRSASDYYSRSSSAQFVDRIRKPTLLIHAADDPFVPASAVPLDAEQRNPFITIVVTATGGHVGFIGGWPWAVDFWAERQAARFLAENLATS